MKSITLFEVVSDFAENKDIARDLRTKVIEPELQNGKSVILDFQGVNSATQSFVHALISNTIKTFGVNVLDRLSFKNCNDQIKTIIGIVVDYVQDGMNTGSDL